MTISMPFTEAAASLEAALGPPEDPSSPISFARSVALDEREAPCDEALARLREWGFVEHLIPAVEGGRLRRFDELMVLVRCLSRRDLVSAIAIGSNLLAGLPVWLWGDEPQRRELAALLRAGGSGAFAVSEDAAGSDLLAGAVSAAPRDGGFEISGEKWLIGNANRSSFVTLLARSQPHFSLFFLRRDDLPAGRFRPTAKLPTLGLRGHDVSGMVFDGCRVGSDALLGGAGRGVESVFLTLQYTRTMVSGMALGAADSALRIATRWVTERRLYGRRVIELAPVRQLLAGAFADLLVCEAIALVSARGLAAFPARMSLWSAIAKYVVPTTAEQIVRDASVALSARFYLRQGVADGVFQKIYRDLLITSVFEGTTLVQLSHIATQLGGLASHERSIRGAGRQRAGSSAMAQLFSLGAAQPDWTPRAAALGLSAAGLDEVVQSWTGAVNAFENARPFIADPHGSLPALAGLLARWTDELHALMDEAAAWAGASDASRTTSAAGFELARRYCRVFAASACLQMWLYNREDLEPAWADPSWVAVCMDRLAGRSLGSPSPVPESALEAVAGLLVARVADGQLLGLCPVPIARASAPLTSASDDQ